MQKMLVKNRTKIVAFVRVTFNINGNTQEQPLLDGFDICIIKDLDNVIFI